MKIVKSIPLYLEVVAVCIIGAMLALPALGWTADTGAAVAEGAIPLARQLRDWMQWVVDNQALVGAFIIAIAGIVGTVWQRRHLVATTSALDLVTGAVEVAEGTRPREVRVVRRRVEATAHSLVALAGRALINSINRARQ